MNFIAQESLQKLRGGYYTPKDLAGFLLRWMQELRPARVLEPSCGDGVFLHGNSAITAFELDPVEAAKAAQTNPRAEVRNEDFLAWALPQMGPEGVRFDAVVGNPPFIRYQYLPADFQTRAEQVFRTLHLPFTKHTNAWVPFIMASMALLRPGGRLAMVVPAEILHVTHAQSLRNYLAAHARRIVIVDPEELWFEGTLQGAVLLLIEKGEPGEGLAIYPVKDREFLGLPPSDIFQTPASTAPLQGKWTQALLSAPTRSLLQTLESHPKVHRFHDIAQVDVGIVTGANKFFLVPDETVEAYKLQEWAHPMFGRSEHCPGIVYDAAQHAANAAAGLPTNFLWFQTRPPKAYLALGESQQLPARYKCRIRKPWYTVPSVYATEIGMLKRSHDTPRLILNRLGAYTTDTAYRIRSKATPAESLVAGFLNPLTALSAELEGRHYGGGVLELIPSEIERLLIPLTKAPAIDKLDQTVRTVPVQEILAAQSKTILTPLGLSETEQTRLLEAWRALRNRRHRVS